MMRATLLLASLAACSHAFLLPGAPTPAASRVATAPAESTRLFVVTKETSREGVPMPMPQAPGALAKPFVYLWVDHLGNRIYRATRNIGACPRRLQLWDPLKPDSEQDYPEAGISTAPSFTKYEELNDENLDDWVERGFGEFDDVEESPVAYTIEGQEAPAAASAASAAAEDGDAAGSSSMDDAELSAEIEARYAAYDDYYPPASFDAMVEAVKQSWRTIVLSRGKQGAKAMREFYRDLHKAQPDLEEKIWIMETHATRSPVPGDPDTYNHWMSDEDILKMARVATEGHDDVVEFSGLEFGDVADGIKGEDWVTIPPPLSWFNAQPTKE